MTAEPPFDEREAISPELVLVSGPEAAQRARELLPTPTAPPQAPRRTAPRRPPTPAARPRPRLTVVEAPPEKPRGRRRGRRLALVVGLVLVLGVGGYVVTTHWLSSAAATPAATTGPADFVPARRWTWSARPGAVGYEVTFYLADRVVLRAKPTRPSFVLPPSFRFEPGTYRWTVRALPGSPVGPIVDSAFVLTRAEAAAANGA
jgi:hypothetical protein